VRRRIIGGDSHVLICRETSGRQAQGQDKKRGDGFHYAPLKEDTALIIELLPLPPSVVSAAIKVTGGSIIDYLAIVRRTTRAGSNRGIFQRYVTYPGTIKIPQLPVISDIPGADHAVAISVIIARP
jgi:Glu-tRNA(Gln) amidotransferase subunit E-like FAD-binding protein